MHLVEKICRQVIFYPPNFLVARLLALYALQIRNKVLIDRLCRQTMLLSSFTCRLIITFLTNTLPSNYFPVKVVRGALLLLYEISYRNMRQGIYLFPNFYDYSLHALRVLQTICIYKKLNFDR